MFFTFYECICYGSKVNNTGVYEGAFDAAAVMIVRGYVQHEEQTVMYSYGEQYTHGGYVGWKQPPCRGQPASKPCPVQSGIQRVTLRKNGFVSLSTTSSNGNAPGVLTTNGFQLPQCSGTAPQVLQLNIFTSIGLGATVELADADSGAIVARSTLIQDGGGVAYNVSWKKPGASKREWVNAGCAYESGSAPDKCGEGQCVTFHTRFTLLRCEFVVHVQ
jgi:hypothetical protein